MALGRKVTRRWRFLMMVRKWNGARYDNESTRDLMTIKLWRPCWGSCSTLCLRLVVDRMGVNGEGCQDAFMAFNEGGTRVADGNSDEVHLSLEILQGRD